MMNKITTLGMALLILASCTEGEKTTNAEMRDEAMTEETTESKIQLIPIEGPAAIPGASLKTLMPESGANLQDGMLEVKYDVSAFTLGTQTSERTDYDLAESDKGQHIHAILNNEPYMAHYEPMFSKDLSEGHYLLLSFLSRSYHLSLKNEEAAELIQFTVGNSDQEPYDLSQPFLFYSRPKGTYDVGQKPDVLLDFYVMNCQLSESGYKIMADIAGTEFTIDSWQPYIIQGLTEGNHSVTLELVDSEGNTVDSPFNPVTRNIEITNTAGE
ncbi:MAG: hypothetical protein WBG42_03160 [Cryomorphaceae bacterium]